MSDIKNESAATTDASADKPDAAAAASPADKPAVKSQRKPRKKAAAKAPEPTVTKPIKRVRKKPSDAPIAAAAAPAEKPDLFPPLEKPKPPQRYELPKPPPRSEKPKPAPRSEKPAPRSEKSAARSEKPAPRSDRPASRSDRPAAHSEKPAPRSDRPASRSDRPASRSDRPASRSEKPAPRSEKPAPRSDRPAPAQRDAGHVVASADQADVDGTPDQPRRKVRRRRAVDKVDAPPGAEPAAEAKGDGGESRRRDGRSAGPRDGRGGRPRDGRPGRPHDGRPGRPRDGRPGGGRDGRGEQPRGPVADSPLSFSQRRNVYRQDVVGTPVPEPPPEPKADGKPKADDRTTLILHPAPKAAPRKRSHDSRRPKTAKEALKARLAKRTGGQKPQKQASVSETPELQEAWFDVDATKVAATIAEAGAAGEALVKAWLERNNTVAIAAAAQLDGIAGSARKAARRALGVLKSRGVEIPDFGATAEPVAKQAEPVIASFVPPDASGMEFFSISQRQPGGRYHVADVVVREPLGIMHASSGRIAGKHIREWRTRVEERFGTAPVDVPLAWARFRFAEARKLNATSKQLLPLGVDKCAELFEPQEDTVPDHPVAELEGGIDADAAKAASATSELLHQDPEFRSWLPDKPALDEMLGKIGERVGRDNAEDKDLVDEVLKEEIAAATDRFFSPEIREVIANRMRDSAISIRERAGGERAIQVLAVAKAVREAGLITSPPSEIPFLLSFFKKGVAIMAQQGAGKIQVPMPG